MFSICYCFIESLCGLEMAKCNQSHLFISSPPPFSFSLTYILQERLFFLVFPSFKSLPFSRFGYLIKGCERRTCAEQTPKPSFSSAYQRKLTDLPKKKGRKKLCLKEKTLELLSAAMCHHLFPMRGSWNRCIRIKCWNWEVFLLCFGDRCFLVKPSDLSEHGTVSRREGTAGAVGISILILASILCWTWCVQQLHRTFFCFMILVLSISTCFQPS